MENWTTTLFKLTTRHHTWGSLGIVLVATMVISVQVTDRQGFANGDLYEDVMNRWGTRIDQPAPSVRYVESGTVFTTLKPLGLSLQQIKLDAVMNYRKRGLVYFSGFDFTFAGTYEVANPEERDIDIVFVFPVSLDRNKVLLSELDFTVNGEPSKVELSEQGDKIVWTGRLKKLENARFQVSFKGRGLDSFTYRLDPSLAAKNFSLAMTISGGDNYDYPSGVVPAHLVEQSDDVVRLHWEYPSLESGVSVGAILPSEKSFDQLISTMARRSWAPFFAFFIALVALMASLNRKIKFYEAYLIAAGYGFFFVLLAYLAAFMNFYVAYFVTSTIIVGLLASYGSRLLDGKAKRSITGLLIAFLTVPTAAVIAQGYTGLIYSLEILGGLATLMFISTHPKFSALLETLIPQEEVSHEA
jgi:hypothetical protein